MGEDFPLYLEGPAPSLCFRQLGFSWLPCGCSGTPSPKSWAQGSIALSVLLWGSSILSSTGILKSCPTLSTSLAPVSPACLCLVDLVFLLFMTTSRWLLQRINQWDCAPHAVTSAFLVPTVPVQPCHRQPPASLFVSKGYSACIHPRCYQIQGFFQKS